MNSQRCKERKSARAEKKVAKASRMVDMVEG
jgi:hypothetical protein